MHYTKGPYSNLKDFAVSSFIGVPSFQCYRDVCVNQQVEKRSFSSLLEHGHCNKCAEFDSSIGFMT